MQDQAKTLPHSKEAEMMVLGCMLTSINSLNIGADGLNENDFYYKEHAIIFRSLKSCFKNDKPADVHIIVEDLKRQNKLQEVGGVVYLTTIAQYAGTSAYIEEYVDEVKIQALRRCIFREAQQIEKKALDGHADVFCTLSSASDVFKQLEKYRNYKDKFSIKFLNQLDLNPLYTKSPEKPMLFEYTDEKGKKIGFLPKGIVAMIVGAGGLGKTHLLAQIAISIITGTPLLDIITPTSYCGEGKKGNVFLGLGENQDDDICRLIYKASKMVRANHRELLDDASRRLAVYSFCGQHAAFIENGKPTRYYKDLKMRLEETAPEGGWSLIILDPVSRLLGTESEVDNATATQFIALLEELTIDLPGNPTILFAHHVTKAAQAQGSKQDQSASRGASGLTDGVRWQMNITKTQSTNEQSQHITLKMTKSNFTAILNEIELVKDCEGYLKRNLHASHKPCSSKRKPINEKSIYSLVSDDEDNANSNY